MSVQLVTGASGGSAPRSSGEALARGNQVVATEIVRDALARGNQVVATEIVYEALARGNEVVATARRPKEIPAPDGVLTLPLNVSGRTPGTRRGRLRSTGVRPDRCSGERRRTRPLAQGFAPQGAR
ncbi:MAG TPA: hypothetical protein VGD15_07590 [Kribbella sp.]